MKLVRLPAVSWLIALLAAASPASPRALGQDGGERIYQRVLKSTTWVLIPIGKKGNQVYGRSGSGSLVDAHRRIVLTNYHVVGEKDEAYVFFPIYDKKKLVVEKDFYTKSLDKLSVHGKVIARDKKRDLALIELKSLPDGVLPLRLAATSASPGQDVHSVGNPGRSGALWLYTYGKVKQVYPKKWSSRADGGVMNFEAEVVETQSPTNPGDSGGPLVNNRHELVGVTQGSAVDASLLSLFIDVTEVRTFLKSNKVRFYSGPDVADRTLSDTPRPLEGGKPAEGELRERQATSKLNLVKVLVTDGKKDKALERLAELIQEYPNTKAAEEAKQLQQKLNK